MMSATNLAIHGAIRIDEYRPLRIYSDSVQAGFPSPAESWVENTLDLNELCLLNPESSFLTRVRGDSMSNVGFSDGDIVVIDRAVPAVHNSIVVARIGPDVFIRRIETKPVLRLVPEDEAYTPLLITPDDEVEIMGVVTFAIKRMGPVTSTRAFSDELDLNDLCIRKPDSSFFVRVRGDSMINAGIGEGDVLLLDRAIPAVHNSIVVARVGPDVTVKRLETRPVERLVPANDAYQPLLISDYEVEIIGTVTCVIKHILRSGNKRNVHLL